MYSTTTAILRLKLTDRQHDESQDYQLLETRSPFARSTEDAPLLQHWSDFNSHANIQPVIYTADHNANDSNKPW